MARVELPYVQAFTDRHGKRRLYYRRRSYARVALPDIAEPGFLAAYEAAGARPEPSRSIGSESTAPGSVSALLAAYYASAEWANLKPSTQRGYRNMLERFREQHGTKRVATIEPHHLEAIFDAVAVGTSGAAQNLRKRLRRVFRLAVKMRWRRDNPVRNTDAPSHRVRGFTPWSEDDIAAFERKWPAGSRERRALYLLLYTGQRRSDAVGMGRQHTRGGRIHVRQLKTDTLLAISIHPTLQRELDAAPADDLTFILTEFGKPFSAAGFTSWFRERAEMAGLRGRTPHGLRKAAGRRLAEAGCTAKQIAAVLGHASLNEVERYTRDADQMRLADAAIAKIWDAS